jgi:hypothetical protein
MRTIKLFIFGMIISCTYLYGQVNNVGIRIKILSENQQDTILRRKIVDSIITESFDYTKANEIKLFLNILKKEDFSENAKKRLVEYFDRSLTEYEKDNIKENCIKRIENLYLEEYKQQAVLQNIPFEEYYQNKLNKEISVAIQYAQKEALNNISSVYPRLLGWLNYKPAISVLKSVIEDSLTNKEYARNNKDDFILNCKLALARMGDMMLEDELINKYKSINIDYSDANFNIIFNNLFYINTRNSINQSIRYLSDKKINQIDHPDANLGIKIPSYSNRNVILIYLSTVIVDYPIKFEYPEDSGDLFISFPYMTIIYATMEYYIKQMDDLEKWLKANKNTYKVNTERFF